MHPDRVLLEVVDGGELLRALVTGNGLRLRMNAVLMKPEVVLRSEALTAVAAPVGGFAAAAAAAGPTSLSPPLSIVFAS